MPSTCPKCRSVVEDDEICCAQVRYTWICTSCHKRSRGFAVPYGKCFLCGGGLEVVEDAQFSDPARLRAVREAIQCELNSFHFYKLARQRVIDSQLRSLIERLYESELDHLHELEEKYHAHLDPEVIDLAPGEQKLLADWLFQGLNLSEAAGVRGIYAAAIEMERRTRDHFQRLAAAAQGFERDLYLELAAEEEEHVAMLETEAEQLRY